MSFFELDGGAKKKAKKSTKAKSTKKTPTKKSTSGKKTKKGGNFLGTVSELFAPAGWENFVTAAGLLALDRTDNYLRKSKDSKKQKGGVDDIPKMEEEMTGGARKRSSSRKHRGGADDIPKMEEEMTGGARKRSSSRKQRGGSDGHHTIEALDMMDGGEEPEMTSQPDAMSQIGGAKKRSKSKSKSKPKVKKTVKKVRKHTGGEFMTPEQKQQFLNLYDSQNYKTNTNQSSNSSRRIQAILEAVGVSISPNTIGEMDLVSEARQLIKNRNFNQSLQQQANAQQTNVQQANVQQSNAQQTNVQQANRQPSSNNTPSSLFGGKPKSKSKSSSKKPKSKKPKTKAKKAPKRK